jgi:hypothetical protein
VWEGPTTPVTPSGSESVPDRSLLATSMLCDATRTSRLLLCWAGCCMRAAVLCGAAVGCLALAACLLAAGRGATPLCGSAGGGAAATRLFGCRGVLVLSRSLLTGSRGAGLAAAALLVVVLAGKCVLSGCALLISDLDPLKCFMICSQLP